MGRYTDASSRLGYPYFGHFADHIIHRPDARQTQNATRQDNATAARRDENNTPLHARKAWLRHLLFRRCRTAPTAATFSSTSASHLIPTHAETGMDTPADGHSPQSEMREPTIVLSFAESRKARRRRGTSLLFPHSMPTRQLPADAPITTSTAAAAQLVANGEPLPRHDREKSMELRPHEAPERATSVSATPCTRPHSERDGELLGNIADIFTNASNALQENLALVAERAKSRQGLSLEDVRLLLIDAGDCSALLPAVTEKDVRTAFAKIGQFNNIVRRLEQMAQNEPLDEGWNDLIPGRLLDLVRALNRAYMALDPCHTGPSISVNAGPLMSAMERYS
jgi:hypothetical protein